MSMNIHTGDIFGSDEIEDLQRAHTDMMRALTGSNVDPSNTMPKEMKPITMEEKQMLLGMSKEQRRQWYANRHQQKLFSRRMAFADN